MHRGIDWARQKVSPSMSRRVALLFAMLLLWPFCSPAQPPKTDALQFFTDVTHQYAEATQWDIEYTTEHRQTSERQNLIATSRVISAQGTGNRYHFEIRDRDGFGLVVSNGVTEWQLNEPMGQYVVGVPGTYGHPFASTITSGEPPVRVAFFAPKSIGSISAGPRSAHWDPEETIEIAGHKVPCYVIRFGTADYPPVPQARQALPTSSTEIERFWIDKSRRVIVKMEQTADSLRGKPGNPYSVATHSVTTTVYTTVRLNQPPPDSLFTFTAPAEASLVAHFSDPYNGTVREANPPKPAVRPNYVGQSAPTLTLKAVDGRTLDISSLRGHPVLLDLWATWCGPCIFEMPAIDRIQRFAGPAGLSLIMVDQDKNPSDAVDYLKRQHYDWPNYHDGWNGKYNQLGLKMSLGLPTKLLIDASGTIAYYHEGADDDEGLRAAIRKLGPQFAAAMDKAEQ